MVYQIIQQIAATASTNAKRDILSVNKDNPVLREVFRLAYHPTYNFWIKPAECSAPEGSFNIDLERLEDLMCLVNREVTGDAARDFLDAMMIPLTFNDRDLLARIVNHDLRCGASDTIAQKIWPCLVPEFPVMLCDKLSQKNKTRLENHKGTLIGELKQDGGRVLVTIDDENVYVRSRNGSILETYGIFDTYFTGIKNVVLDGELLITNPDGTPNRKLSNGIYNKLVRGTATREEAEQFKFVLWDIVPLTEYQTGKGTQPYRERREILSKIKFPTDRVQVVESFEFNNFSECMDYFARVRAMKQEGIIIKFPDSKWEDSRSKDWIKVKAVETGDFICIGTEYGTGKYSDMIGSLQCESRCGKVKFSVGTGLVDADRTKDPSEFIGHIVEIEYNELISSKGRDTMSLFLPVYVQTRYDKSVANSFEELK